MEKNGRTIERFNFYLNLPHYFRKDLADLTLYNSTVIMPDKPDIMIGNEIRNIHFNGDRGELYASTLCLSSGKIKYR
jgi:hypothetical protein